MSFNLSLSCTSEYAEFEEQENEYIIQDSIIFLVDGSKQMFENNFLKQCLETYKNIIRQKCSQNKKDKLGFMIYGSNKTNCEVNSLMILQKFDFVTVDTLKDIKNIINTYNEYDQWPTISKFSLYDIFSYVFQQIHTSKTNTKTRYIILLCTCNDNPCYKDNAEKRRIDHLVSTFKDSQTELRVIGFSKSWNENIYYKHLQIISGAFDKDNYKRIYLNDFEKHILNPARSICKLPWKISTNICIDVILYNLVSAPKYPTKIKLEKENNKILEARHILHEQDTEDSQSENDIEGPKNITSRNNITYYKIYGGLKISFTASECKQIKNLGLEPSIEILAFQPINCDPLNHVASPYFVTYNDNINYENKIFFMSLISRCSHKKVMAICKVVTKFTVLICQMIPSCDDGGFYMYKIPWNDNIRNLHDMLPQYIYDFENECPKNEHVVDCFIKAMNLSMVKFDPKLFANQKLEKCIAHIEALALDETLNYVPIDGTLPPPLPDDAEDLINVLIDLLNLHDRTLGTKNQSRSQIGNDNKKSKLNIEDVASNRQLQTLTVKQLKEFLSSVNQSIQGNKSVLINRIYDYLQL